MSKIKDLEEALEKERERNRKLEEKMAQAKNLPKKVKDVVKKKTKKSEPEPEPESEPDLEEEEPTLEAPILDEDEIEEEEQEQEQVEEVEGDEESEPEEEDEDEEDDESTLMPRKAAPILDGPMKVYKYWDFETRSWIITTDIWVANQASPNLWEICWIYIKDGIFDHILTAAEMQKYLP